MLPLALASEGVEGQDRSEGVCPCSVPLSEEEEEEEPESKMTKLSRAEMCFGVWVCVCVVFEPDREWEREWEEEDCECDCEGRCPRPCVALLLRFTPATRRTGAETETGKAGECGERTLATVLVLKRERRLAPVLVLGIGCAPSKASVDGGLAITVPVRATSMGQWCTRECECECDGDDDDSRRR